MSPRLLEFITDDVSGKFSSNSLWYNIGNCALTAVFVHAMWDGGLTWDIIAAYGGVVCGSKLAQKLVTGKMEKRDGVNTADKSGQVGPV